MRCVLKTAAGSAALLLLLTAPLAAQSDEDKLKSLLQELDSLIDKGESQNLADPWFLQDLRALSERYGETWPVVLLDHRFDSRSTLPKAPWQVHQGDMKMDWSRGLRSRVEAKAVEAKAKSDDELAREMIGSILGKALGGKDSQPATTPDPTEPALAEAEIAVSNAFQMRAEITARAMPGADEGAFELGVYQTGGAGYRLILQPKAEAGAVITLVAVSARGSRRVIDSADYEEVTADDAPLTLTLARRPNGLMSAALDETELFSASDKSFNDPFQGALIANRGGDYAIKWMTIRGTK